MKVLLDSVATANFLRHIFFSEKFLEFQEYLSKHHYTAASAYVSQIYLDIFNNKSSRP